MITVDNFVSVSELRDNTSQVIKDLLRVWKKVVLSQNKPVWIFLSVEEFNAMKKLSFEKEQATIYDIKAYKESSHWQSWVDAFSFLNSLK